MDYNGSTVCSASSWYKLTVKGSTPITTYTELVHQAHAWQSIVGMMD